MEIHPSGLTGPAIRPRSRFKVIRLYDEMDWELNNVSSDDHRPSPVGGSLEEALCLAHDVDFMVARISIRGDAAFPRFTDYLLAPILNSFVLQTGQVPSVAGRPFFKVTCLGAVISLFALHLTQ